MDFNSKNLFLRAFFYLKKILFFHDLYHSNNIFFLFPVILSFIFFFKMIRWFNILIKLSYRRDFFVWLISNSVKQLPVNS